MHGGEAKERYLTLNLDEVRVIANLAGTVAPPLSGNRFLGPLFNFLRKLGWKLVGLENLLHQQLQQLTAALGQKDARFRPQFRYRAGTLDQFIFYEVAAKNEYRLPPAFRPDDVVVDIGMHIGSFSWAALMRGCRHLYGFEAQRENFELARTNLAGFGERAHVYHRAVWRSDRKGDRLFLGDPGQNTGGASLLFLETGEQPEVVAFDDLVHEITQGGKRRIHLLKIDCEGSEYPILLTSRALHLIDNIHGEFHEINDGVYDHTPIPAVARIDGVERFTMRVLADCLLRAGFVVRWQRAGKTGLGLFFATRPSSR